MKNFSTILISMLFLGVCLSMKAPEYAEKQLTSRPQADSTTKDKLEFFHFQTSGTPKRLLSVEAYQTILQAAKLSGYEESELEVIVYVVDKKSKEERRAPLPNFNTTPYRGSTQQKSKLFPKKFE